MKNSKTRKNYQIPGEAVDACGFDPNTPLCFHAQEDVLVAVPADMTALQAARAIDALTCLAAELLGELKDACGPCGGCPDGCPYEDTDGPDAELSGAVRTEMGVPEGHKLHVEVCDGVAHVYDAGYRHDITDISPVVRRMLEGLGACMGSLDELLMQNGGVVCHD